MDSGFEDSYVNLDDDMDIRFSYSVSSDGSESDEPNDIADEGRDKNKRMVWRQFLCNRAGLRDPKYLIVKVIINLSLVPTAMLGCRFALTIVHQNGKWWHLIRLNHDLTPPKFVPCISTYRGLNDADKAQVEVLHSHGVRLCQILGLMELVELITSVLDADDEDGLNVLGPYTRIVIGGLGNGGDYDIW
ncbi:FAR1-related protein [Sesbania bispinosa]|nr:FAR1-related protein [Sesbania bispinosa]